MPRTLNVDDLRVKNLTVSGDLRGANVAFQATDFTAISGATITTSNGVASAAVEPIYARKLTAKTVKLFGEVRVTAAGSLSNQLRWLLTNLGEYAPAGTIGGGVAILQNGLYTVAANCVGQLYTNAGNIIFNIEFPDALNAVNASGGLAGEEWYVWFEAEYQI